jgi:hypothetical protein
MTAYRYRSRWRMPDLGNHLFLPAASPVFHFVHYELNTAPGGHVTYRVLAAVTVPPNWLCHVSSLCPDFELLRPSMTAETV